MRNMPDSPPLYLSYVHARPYSEVYKVHPQLKNARAAVALTSYGAGVRGGKIWKWERDEWVLLYDIKPGTKHSDLPWKAKQLTLFG